MTGGGGFDGGSSAAEQGQMVPLSNEAAEAIVAGLKDALAHGPTRGYAVHGIEVLLVQDGCQAGLDSTPTAWQHAARSALTAALLENDPVVLEPVMLLEARAPGGRIGSVLGDLPVWWGPMTHTHTDCCIYNMCIDTRASLEIISRRSALVR